MNQENEVIEESVEQTPEQLSEILQIRREKLAELKANNNDPYQITTFGVDTYAKDIIEKFDDFDGKNVVVAGRIISWRDMGKASFIDISDRSGKIQVYIKINIVGEENYAEFGKWDIGDIVGIDGEAFKTHKGEISVKAHSLKLLSKSLRPLPEKWHGLKDTDIRYRQRYVDLIVNPEVKDTFEKRSKIIKEIRNFLDNRGYLEVETPVLHSIAGGAAARPFITHHNSLDIDMYLRIALELHLKRLIVGGFDRVYEIGRVFRNEGMDVRHNPEFTMLEFYQAYTNYIGMMDISEELIREVAQKVLGTTEVTYGEVQIDFGKAFERISMVDAVKKYADVDFDVVTDLETARNLAKEHHIEFENRHGIGDILNLFFEEYVEEKLMQPTFVTGHPVEISPLAKKNAADPRYTERFELFVYGRELSNGFSELNDPIDQKERFMHQLDLKAQGDDEATDMDDDFINALEHGLPPTGGIGIGIDRLVMFLTNAASIRDVLLFPTMKPINN
ncbi:MAG: lysine--tRNA ligase [Oscillospiraceae bacterium]